MKTQEWLHEDGTLNKEYILTFIQTDTTMYPYDMALMLKDVQANDGELYSQLIQHIPNELLAEVMLKSKQDQIGNVLDVIEIKDVTEMAESLDTNDAAELIKEISVIDSKRATEVMETLSDNARESIETIKSYNTTEAGAWMQVNLFQARIDETVGESIHRLKKLKSEKKIDNINQVFIVNDNKEYLGSISLEDLILLGSTLKYKTILNENLDNLQISDHENLEKVAELMRNYNISSMAIVDHNNKLVGSISSDRVYSMVEKIATEQIYNLAGVKETSEKEESLFAIGKDRAIWLGINLITAILASIVIGIFDNTIQSLVALAVLMPIVASMGGNAGTQSLTVTVRQIALGDIAPKDAKETIRKEILISISNGLIFAAIMGIVAYIWFDIPLLGMVIAISMIINLLSAGFFGAIIPLGLKRAGIDPAIGSTVLLTTVTDIVGFFSFLGLATIVLL